VKQYVDLLNKILSEGERREDRTGVGTLSIFGGQLSFDLRQRFPLVTIKKTLWKHAFIEMLWFLRGEPNIKYLHDHGVHIWDQWAKPDGSLGPVYGVQWRRWPGAAYEAFGEDRFKHHSILTREPGRTVVFEPPIDQIKNLIERIKTRPRDRRLIVSAWNPAYVEKMGLPPCHRDFQCYVSNDGHLDLMMAIRSWDTCLGGPFNIAQYALLTHLLARATSLKPRHLKINYGDAHIYLNHVEKMREILSSPDRAPIDCPTGLDILTDNTDIDGYKPEDFDIVGYRSHPFVKLEVAV